MANRARPLRLKLTLWFLAVFLVIQLVLLTALVLARRDAVERGLRLAIQRSVEQMVDSMLAAKAGFVEEKLVGLMPEDSGFRFWVIRNAEGVTIAQWRLVADGEELFSRREARPTGPLTPVFIDLKPEGAERAIGERVPLSLVAVPFQLQDGAQFFLQAGVYHTPLQRLLGPYEDLFVVGVPVGLLAALAAAWLIAGRAVAPMLEISEAARGVSPTSLGERIRVSSADEEVRRLEDDLNSALERLEQGYRAQEEFIANVSHELKTPIAVLLTEAQVAQLGADGGAATQAFVQKVEREMQRLGRLVESFLTLARAELSTGRPEPVVSTNDFVLEAVQVCGVLAERAGKRLVPLLVDIEQAGREPLVHGDSDLLRTMVENLLTNAIRHSPDGGQVEVLVELVPEHVRIHVRDHGPGIPPEYVDKIFDRFVQAPSRAGRKDGSGLGLAIASHVARLHGGAIRARNHAEGGCSFVVELPLAREVRQAAAG